MRDGPGADRTHTAPSPAPPAAGAISAISATMSDGDGPGPAPAAGSEGRPPGLGREALAAGPRADEDSDDDSGSDSELVIRPRGQPPPPRVERPRAPQQAQRATPPAAHKRAAPAHDRFGITATAARVEADLPPSDEVAMLSAEDADRLQLGGSMLVPTRVREAALCLLRAVDEVERVLSGYTFDRNVDRLGVFENIQTDVESKRTMVTEYLTAVGKSVDGFGKMMDMLGKRVHNIYTAQMELQSADNGQDATTSSMTLQYMKEVPAEKKRGFPGLLMFLRTRFQSGDLRKNGGTLYRRVITATGLKTVAWVALDGNLSGIRDFVQACVTANTSMWVISIAGDNFSNAVRYFTEREDLYLPAIEKNKSIFSYENGVYEALSNTFSPYPIDDPEHKLLAKGARVPAKHFPGLEFPVDDHAKVKDGAFERWRGIETPAFDGIFTSQDIPRDAIDFIYVLFGRWFFKNGELDRWQALPWIIGYAGTGKSTLCMLMRFFYEADDVGIMSNNIETKFGLSQVLYKKFAFVAPEIRSTVSLDFAELLSAVVPGERMSLAVKFNDPKLVEVDAVGLICGNSMIDNIPAASIDAVFRRAIIIRFQKAVAKEDPRLEDKLRAESPRLMLKMVCALRHFMLEPEHHASIWDCIPRYFTDIRDELSKSVDPLRHFLASDGVELGEGLTVDFSAFQAAFNQHCQNNRFKAGKLVESEYGSTFHRNGLHVAPHGHSQEVNEHGKRSRKLVIRGLRLTGAGREGYEGDF